MVLPAPRYRARKWKALGFVQAASDAESNANATVVMTTGPSKLLIGVATNSIGSTAIAVQVDGVTLAPIGSVTSTRIHRVFAVDVAAGEHTINTVGGGSWRTMIVAEYGGVATVGPHTSDVSSSGSASVTPAGAGSIGVAFIANGDARTATSDDIVRAQQAGVSTTYSLALVENSTRPLNLTISGAWSAGGVWLS